MSATVNWGKWCCSWLRCCEDQWDGACGSTLDWETLCKPASKTCQDGAGGPDLPSCPKQYRKRQNTRFSKHWRPENEACGPWNGRQVRQVSASVAEHPGSRGRETQAEPRTPEMSRQRCGPGAATVVHGVGKGCSESTLGVSIGLLGMCN